MRHSSNSTLELDAVVESLSQHEAAVARQEQARRLVRLD